MGFVSPPHPCGWVLVGGQNPPSVIVTDGIGKWPRRPSHGQTVTGTQKRIGPMWNSDPSYFFWVLDTYFTRTIWIGHYLNESVGDKIRSYRADYNNRPSNTISFVPHIGSTFTKWICATSSFTRSPGNWPIFCRFRSSSSTIYQWPVPLPCGVLLAEKISNILAKAAILRIVLNIDDTPIPSKSHTHPSHSQTSRLLTSSPSLSLPVPRSTQCMRPSGIVL
jgi:hypothetical protein